MPVSTSDIFTCQTFRSARDITADVWAALESEPRGANTILPHARTALEEEKMGKSIASNQLWISCSSHNPLTVDLVLAIVDGQMGSYPLFIFSPHPFATFTDEYLAPRMDALVSAVRAAVPVNRIYSVFAPEPITRLFVHLWSEATGIEGYIDEPYYAAKISYCTARSLVNRQISVHPDFAYELRPAVDADIFEIAALCYAFAADSDPFFLTPYGALTEAAILIEKKQVWVHRIRQQGWTGSEIACIVAFTRNTEKVATISKVFTNPYMRNRGCAERLVRRVCKHLLTVVETVVLFVAHDNQGAARVYSRVGFAGLADDSPPVEGVHPYLEVGFDREKTTLGHW